MNLELHCTKKNNQVICEHCQYAYSIKNDVLYTNDVPQNVPERTSSKQLMENWGMWRNENFKHIESHLSTIPSSAHILDLGAGKSPYRTILNQKIYPNLISLDFAPFYQINITADINKKLPFQGDIFDVIILSNVLEHVSDPLFTLQECFRITKKGGLVIAQTPFLMGLHDEPYDFYRYTKYGLIHLLETTGYNRIVVKELSSTNDVVMSLMGIFFSEYMNLKKKMFFLRILRKIIFLILRIIYRLYGENTSQIQPKGYGWLGYK